MMGWSSGNAGGRCTQRVEHQKAGRLSPRGTQPHPRNTSGDGTRAPPRSWTEAVRFPVAAGASGSARTRGRPGGGWGSLHPGTTTGSAHNPTPQALHRPPHRVPPEPGSDARPRPRHRDALPTLGAGPSLSRDCSLSPSDRRVAQPGPPMGQGIAGARRPLPFCAHSVALRVRHPATAWPRFPGRAFHTSRRKREAEPT